MARLLQLMMNNITAIQLVLSLLIWLSHCSYSQQDGLLHRLLKRPFQCLFLLKRPDHVGQPVAADMTSRFTAIADVPYSNSQADILRNQIRTQVPANHDFLIHLGDMQNSSKGVRACSRENFLQVEKILRLSPVPVFAILGDNDWNDCSNADEAKYYWETIFVGFETKYWGPRFTVARHPTYNSTFSFINKNTLYIGLNLVGGRVLNKADWNTRETAMVTWTIDLIRQGYYSGLAKSVVIFGHVDPNMGSGTNHKLFFSPLADFIANELRNNLPIMYLNGDKHVWDYNTNFKNQNSWLQITLSGTAKEPPTLFTINGWVTQIGLLPSDQLFLFDRQLL